MLARKHRLALTLQRWVSYTNLPWFVGLFLVLLKGIARYRCDDVEGVRRKAASLIREAGGRPVVICANHLTMIDSMIINWLLFSFFDYARDFRLFPWNMPEQGNFATNLPLRVMCFLGKCLYIRRGGSVAERKLTLEKFKYLLSRRELICIFPEGTRSRSGRIRGSAPTYSVGELCLEVPGTLVLCVYLRGAKQDTWGYIPRRGDNFHVDLELLEPKATSEGRRGAKEIAVQIVDRLSLMEDRYFQSRPAAKRVSTSANPTSIPV